MRPNRCDSREKLTVIIPAKNERNNIRACINAIRGLADEIVVADSGSTDGTLGVVRSLEGCRVIEREYVDSGDFKNWAIPQAKHDWVLIVDCDERVTHALAGEIRDLLRSPDCDGYWIRRRNFFCGHEIRYSGWNNDRVLRLFRRDLGRYTENGDHAEVNIPSGKVGQLKQSLLHFSYWTLGQYLHKLDRYTTQAAEARFQQGKRAGIAQLMLRAPLRFFHTYVIRRGFLDGKAGLVVCLMTSYYSVMKLMKMWALDNALSQPPAEPTPVWTPRIAETPDDTATAPSLVDCDPPRAAAS